MTIYDTLTFNSLESRVSRPAGRKLEQTNKILKEYFTFLWRLLTFLPSVKYIDL